MTKMLIVVVFILACILQSPSSAQDIRLRPVTVSLTSESITKDMIGKTARLPSGEDWEFGNRSTERTTVKSIKKITFVTESLMRLEVDIDAHLC